MSFSIYPDIIIKTSASVNIRDFLAYETILLNPQERDIDNIILNKVCSRCLKPLKYTDCFSRASLRISLIRTCHYCNIIFLLNGKYNSREKFDHIYNYFKKIREKR